MSLSLLLPSRILHPSLAKKLNQQERVLKPVDKENEGYYQEGEKFDPTKVKVLVEYNTERGKENAKKKAKRIGYESKRFKIIAMEIDEKDMLAFENDPTIQSISLDEEKHIIYPIKESKPPPKKPVLRRQLAENVPYGVKKIQADQVSPGPFANDITLCVVDTGFDYGHQDLPGAGIVSGVDNSVYRKKDWQWDEDGHGHGTHCAGIVAAVGDNGIDYRGAVKNAATDGIKLHIGKGLTNKGSGSTAGVLEAVDQCIDAGARIISLSLGGGGPSSTEETMYKKAYDEGILIVAAASNDGDSSYSYPASYEWVMSVAATDSNNERASFSNYNDQVEIAAPGDRVWSTLPGKNYEDWSGTSMATPYVAGVAALLWSHDSRCSVKQIRRILLASADSSRANTGCDNYYGRGLVQAKAAVDMLKGGGCSAADNLPLLDPTTGTNTDGTCSTTYGSTTTASTTTSTGATAPEPTATTSMTTTTSTTTPEPATTTQLPPTCGQPGTACQNKWSCCSQICRNQGRGVKKCA